MMIKFADWKIRIMSLFSDAMIVYIGNPKLSTKNTTKDNM